MVGSIGLAAGKIPTLSTVMLRLTTPLICEEAPVTPAASMAVVVVSIEITA